MASSQNSIKLENGCLVAYGDGSYGILSPNVRLNIYSEVLLFRFLDDNIEVTTFYPSNNQLSTTITNLYDGGKIKFGGKEFELSYCCEDEELENLLDAFMNGDLVGTIDIRRQFLKYAEKYDISSQTVVCYAVTVLDVPENDY